MIQIEGKVCSISFGGQPVDLKTITYDQLDINTAPPACFVEMQDGSKIAVSRWTTPKRTRTYPFARIYDTYSYNGKIVTVIPILKDEGADTNNDRINFITLSWMNLMNIYIILAWYEDAERKSDKRLGKQRLNKQHISQKILEIYQYRQDAHHWNIHHFRTEFVNIYQKAVDAYQKVSQLKKVALHPASVQLRFLDSIRSSQNPSEIDLEKFKELTLKSSERAAQREIQTQHTYEDLKEDNAKALIKITNNLGGVYYLTVDEVLFLENNRVLLQESKHASRKTLPSPSDIKDGLFKLILYKQINLFSIDGQEYQHSVRLRITGSFTGTLHFPCRDTQLDNWLKRNNFSKREERTIRWLYSESDALGIPILMEGQDEALP